MHRLKQPASFFRASINGKGYSNINAPIPKDINIPLCIHGHTTIMPLLADYPNMRIDVNPYNKNPKIITNHNWQEKKVNVKELLSSARKFNRCESVIVSLDSFTIENITPKEYKGLDSELILFVGDTQHGPVEGFIELIKLAQTGAFSKVITANNPQHLNLFRACGVSVSSLFYCPLGLSNLPPWIGSSNNTNSKIPSGLVSSLSKNPYFIGSLTDHHSSRRRIINQLSKMGLVRVAKTRSYKEASYYHKSALVALNISLNSDINFRFCEILAAGGVLVTDLLPSVQSQYIDSFFGNKNIHFFKNFADLKLMLSEFTRKASFESIRDHDTGSYFINLMRDQKMLQSLEDLDSYLIPYSDNWRQQVETEIFQKYPHFIKTVESWERIYRYVEVRDSCRNLDNEAKGRRLVVHDDMCPLTLLDSADLQFEEVAIRSSNPALNYVANQISRHEPNYFKICK